VDPSPGVVAQVSSKEEEEDLGQDKVFVNLLIENCHSLGQR